MLFSNFLQLLRRYFSINPSNVRQGFRTFCTIEILVKEILDATK